MMRPVRTPSDEEIIASISDALPLGIWVARAPGGELVFANQTFQEIMGMGARSDVAAGQYAEPYAICGLDGQPYPEEAMPFVRAIRARDTVTLDDIVIHRADGARVHIRAHARPIFADESEPDSPITHVVIAFVDITREVEAESEQRQSHERILRMQRMESVGNLAGGVAHDFNNLLSAIQTIASSLRGGEEDAERVKYLRTIEDIADSAAGLARRLLDFAGSRGGERQRVDLVAIVERVLRNLSASMGALTVTPSLQGPLSVTGDPARLDQAVMNLVLNARDVGASELIVRARTEGARACLDFEDDGPGVPESIREKIFEPYFSTKDGAPEGRSGLGLATVFGVVASHGGDVTLHDAPSGGALFRLYFPLAD
jgi:signal transduction histidine kinase